MRKPPAAYRCGAGVNHYERPSKVEAWKRAEQERVAGEVADKVRAHDDYMEAMRRFREIAEERLYQGPQGPLDQGLTGAWLDGYRQAIRDMDGALIDVMRAREDPT